MKNIFKRTIPAIIALSSVVACTNDFLDRSPLDSTTPENFYKSEADLAAYTINMYGAFPTHGGWNAGTFINDNGTDNQAGVNPSGVWLKNQWRVGTGTENWGFGSIRNVNYFINTVEDRLSKNQIGGNPTNINHYLGEGYFFRAYHYFNSLTSMGDFPIITEVLPDENEVLIEHSKRRPRNEVARFILQDLDKAISLLKSGNVENKNRISKEVALLFKSRVALFEGSWEKYHKGTAFVPKGAGWPGEGKAYLSNYSINIDSEIDFFLTQAMDAAKQVANATTLVSNNGSFNGQGVFSNPYFKMFSDTNMAGYSEVLLWRQYASGLAEHRTQGYLNTGAASGLTKSYVDSYLMDNGLPIYASGSGYQGDVTLEKVAKNRDPRLQMFLQVNGDYLSATTELKIEKPTLLANNEIKSTTGYMLKKGLAGVPHYYSSANPSINGSIVFRATEALLNYIEASYIKNGSLDATATDYWQKLRTRAGLPADFNITVNATDLSKEDDWAKYSKGQLVDKVLYNIRRERRSELIGEGMRWNDLRRWRALDQVNNYQIEGFNLWAEMHTWYVTTKDGVTTSDLIADSSDKANVSPRANSTYLRPYQVRQGNNLFYNGYTWTQAHYLSPIGFRNFSLASPDGSADNSVIYQNPYWPIQPNAGAIQ